MLGHFLAKINKHFFIFYIGVFFLLFCKQNMECRCCFCCQIKLGLVCSWERSRPTYLDNVVRQKPSRETLQFCEMISRIDEIVASRGMEKRSVSLQTAKERRNFRKCVWLAITIESLLLATTLLWTILSRQSRLWFLLRLGNVIRLILLMATLFQNVNLYAIKGEGRTDTLLRHFSIYPPLGLWILVGAIDYYAVRWPLLVGQALYYFLAFLEGEDSASSSLLLFLFFLLLNGSYVAESHVSLNLVYRQGVWMNILSSLRSRKAINV